MMMLFTQQLNGVWYQLPGLLLSLILSRHKINGKQEWEVEPDTAPDHLAKLSF